MNKRGNGLVIAVIVLAVVCVAFLIGGYMILSAWGGGLAFWKNLPDRIGNVENYTISQKHEVDVDEFTEFEFRTVSSNITVEFADTDTVTAELNGTYRSSRGQVKLVKEEIGDKVKIYVDYPKLSGIFSWNNTGLKVTIPRDMSEMELDFGSVSGNVTIPEGLNVESLEIGTTSGNVQINGIECVDFQYDNVSGRLDFVGDVSGEMDMDSVSGYIKVRAGADVKEMDVQTVSSNVFIWIPGNTDFKYNFKTVSGSFNCEFPVFTQGSGNQKEGYTDENAGLDISVNTVSGNLTIQEQ